MGSVVNASTELGSRRYFESATPNWDATDGPESWYVKYGPQREQIDIILDKLGFVPNETQEPVLYTQRRLILAAGGERAGKSNISGIFGATRTMYGKLFWIVGPDYELARPEFYYWLAAAKELGAVRSDRDVSAPKVGPASFKTKTGQIIQTKTADDVRKLAAKAPDGILMTEAAQQPYDSYLRCVGRTAEKRGWLLLSGTFEDAGSWYVEKFNDWKNPHNAEGGLSVSIPSWSNYVIYPGGREDPEILRLEKLYERVPGLFEERLGAQPVPPAYLIFREFRHHVHVSKEVEFNPDLPVFLAVDPSSGTNPYAVLAVQFPRFQYDEPHPDPIDYCHVIDEIYETGLIGEEIIEIAKERYWYKYVRGGAIDVAAPDEQKRWRKYGGVALASDKIHVLEGIRRLKSFLYHRRHPKTNRIIQPPKLQIHPRVQSLPFEFGKYKRQPPKDDERAVKDLPPRDQHNHSIKALWYLLIARYGFVKANKLPAPTNYYSRRRTNGS